MKKLILTFFIAAFAFAAQAQVKTLEKDLTFEKGVKSVNLDLETKVLNIAYIDSKTDPDKLRKRITMVGYNADSLKRDPKAYAKLDECCKDGAHDDDFHPMKKDN